MSSDTRTSHCSGDLSPTHSLIESLASLKTEELDDLYDHTQHPEMLSPIHRLAVRDVVVDENRYSKNFVTSKSNSSVVLNENRLDTGPVMNQSELKSVKPNYSIMHDGQLDNVHKEAISHYPVQHLKVPIQEKRNKSRTASNSSSVNPLHFLSRSISRKSYESMIKDPQKRRMTSTSFDSDHSRISRESQETEEDVCFPMELPGHQRINGIDFDELEEFASQSREEGNGRDFNAPIINVNKVRTTDDKNSSISTSTILSEAAIKYTPTLVVKESEQTDFNGEIYDNSQLRGISFGDNKVELDDINCVNSPNSPSGCELHNYIVPNRFSFFSSFSDETVHAPDIPSLVKPGQSFRNLFKDGTSTWWLDCICPTDEEMRCIAKSFGIHPLTAEDIRMQETREKVEFFKSYYFICFHTFENDMESEDFLEPINMYIVVFREGVLTFHFNSISHSASVRRRVRQLRDYVDVSSDWLCYAIIDDITDSFAPVIRSIEYEADVIEDTVFMTQNIDFSAMLQRIGESRRKTMTLMRLLSGKADVIKMFAKRCHEEINGIGPPLTSNINIANLQYINPATIQPHHIPNTLQTGAVHTQQRSRPRADIALYLGDIQDHVVTMFQNLMSYEKIFSRSHGNYLAQLQVESFNSSNRVSEMLGKVTVLGTVLVPINLVPGLFGMNVRIPGQQGPNLGWFFGIVGGMIISTIILWFWASTWLKRADSLMVHHQPPESGSRSILNFMVRKKRSSQLEHQLGKSNKSIKSLPSKLTHYD